MLAVGHGCEQALHLVAAENSRQAALPAWPRERELLQALSQHVHAKQLERADELIVIRARQTVPCRAVHQMLPEGFSQRKGDLARLQEVPDVTVVRPFRA